MNKILSIDPDDHTCLVEPGVSFYALYEEIKKRGYDHLWIDVPDLGGGSVVGNTLDRGVGYTPYGDHWAAHSGLEVVLPTSEVIRTGMEMVLFSGSCADLSRNGRLAWKQHLANFPLWFWPIFGVRCLFLPISRLQSKLD